MWRASRLGYAMVMMVSKEGVDARQPAFVALCRRHPHGRRLPPSQVERIDESGESTRSPSLWARQLNPSVEAQLPIATLSSLPLRREHCRARSSCFPHASKPLLIICCYLKQATEQQGNTAGNWQSRRPLVAASTTPPLQTRPLQALPLDLTRTLQSQSSLVPHDSVLSYNMPAPASAHANGQAQQQVSIAATTGEQQLRISLTSACADPP